MNKTTIFIFLFLAFHLSFAALPWIHVNKETLDFNGPNNEVLIFHGVNVVYKVYPWMPRTNDNEYDHRTSLTEKDIQHLAAWGFNIVRLGIMWPGVRTNETYINTTYIDEIEKLVNNLGRYGIYTLLDLHQDLISRYYCGEGAPDFLIEGVKKDHYFPWPIGKEYSKEKGTNYPNLTECLSVTNFGEHYFTYQVNNAFEELYNPNSALYKEINLFWEKVSQRFCNNSNVIGYDLINEPIAGHLFKQPFAFIGQTGWSTEKYLQPLYESLHKTIRRFDNEHLIFFEPPVNALLLTSGFTQAPGGADDAGKQVFSYHIYCGFVTGSGCPLSHTLCEYFESAMMYCKTSEMKALKVGGLITEFGALCDDDSCIVELHRFQRKAEEAKQGWIYWQFKHYEDLTTANRDESQGFYYKSAKLQTKKVIALTRPYARVIAGKIKEMRFIEDTKVYKLSYEYSDAVNTSISEVYISNEYYGNKLPKYTVSHGTVYPQEITGSGQGEGNFTLFKIIHPQGLSEGTIIKFTLSPN